MCCLFIQLWFYLCRHIVATFFILHGCFLIQTTGIVQYIQLHGPVDGHCEGKKMSVLYALIHRNTHTCKQSENEQIPEVFETHAVALSLEKVHVSFWQHSVLDSQDLSPHLWSGSQVHCTPFVTFWQTDWKQASVSFTVKIKTFSTLNFLYIYMY